MVGDGERRVDAYEGGAGEDTDFLGLVVVVLEDGKARSGGTQSHGRERERGREEGDGDERGERASSATERKQRDRRV